MMFEDLPGSDVLDIHALNDSGLVSIVFCVDGRRAMEPFIEKIKQSILAIRKKAPAAIEFFWHDVARLRIKIIVFRDYACDGPLAMEESDFFELPDQEEAFEQWVMHIRAQSRSDRPGSALEALSLAIRSEWIPRDNDNAYQRCPIVFFTNDGAMPLQNSFSRMNPLYPSGMPASLEELTSLWDEHMPSSHTRALILISPDKKPWTDMQHWDHLWSFNPMTPKGLSEFEEDYVDPACYIIANFHDLG